ncbi:Palmitoyltransferase [Hexamita inflata]|uniref:Palmitoyltransferase n=1 Tax=Hexamita inflata TaxID=28002 RepID=A0AA86TMX5_9EUKA|nr:Palmitoyltransferase [Hexamita inflata]
MVNKAVHYVWNVYVSALRSGHFMVLALQAYVCGLLVIACVSKLRRANVIRSLLLFSLISYILVELIYALKFSVYSFICGSWCAQISKELRVSPGSFTLPLPLRRLQIILSLVVSVLLSRLLFKRVIPVSNSTTISDSVSNSPQSNQSQPNQMPHNKLKSKFVKILGFKCDTCAHVVPFTEHSEFGCLTDFHHICPWVGVPVYSQNIFVFVLFCSLLTVLSSVRVLQTVIAFKGLNVNGGLINKFALFSVGSSDQHATSILMSLVSCIVGIPAAVQVVIQMRNLISVFNEADRTYLYSLIKRIKKNTLRVVEMEGVYFLFDDKEFNTKDAIKTKLDTGKEFEAKSLTDSLNIIQKARKMKSTRRLLEQIIW